MPAPVAGAGVLADVDGAVTDVGELLAEEHPATAASAPATAASTAMEVLTLRTAIDDTVLPA